MPVQGGDGGCSLYSYKVEKGIGITSPATGNGEPNYETHWTDELSFLYSDEKEIYLVASVLG